MKHHRFPWLAPLMAAFALVAAACGGEGGGGGGTPTAQEDGAVDLSGETVSVVAVWGESTGEGTSFREVLTAFEEQTGATVEYTSSGTTDLTTFIGTRIQGGNPPDMAMLPNPGLLVDFANEGNLQPIEEVAGSLVDENFGTFWRELGSHDGQLYGVFFKGANKSTVWYNTSIFEQAGAEPPPDWEGLVATAQTISDSGLATPFALDGGSAWVLTDLFENVYLRVAGAEKYQQLTNHEIPWTDDSVRTAFETLAQIFGQEDWILGGASGTLQASFPTNALQLGGDSPKAAIYPEGDFLGGILADQANATPGEDVDFFDFPSIAGSEPGVVVGGDVAVLFTESEAAQELIKFLTTPEAAEIWAGLGGFTAPNENVDTSVYPNEPAGRAAESMTTASVTVYDMSDLAPAAFGGTTGQGMFKGLQDFLRNPDDIDGVMQYLEDQAQQAYG